MNSPPHSDAHPKGGLASRPVLARLSVLLLGILVTIAALELGLAAFGRIYLFWRSDQRSVPSDGKTVILCLGDSWTVGQGALPGRSYPSQLDALLNPGAERKYKVVNAALPGANSAIAKSIFLKQVDEVRPQIVTLMIGVANYWNYVGYHPAGQSRLERLFECVWLRLHTIKLARLLFYQLHHKSQPGFQEGGSRTAPGGISSGSDPGTAGDSRRTEPPASEGSPGRPDGFGADWSQGLVRCRRAAGRSGEVRPDPTAEVAALVDSQQLAMAQKRAHEFLRSRPADSRGYVLEGMCQWAGNDIPNARASFEKAHSLAPHDAYAELGMVALKIRQDPGDKASGLISRIISAAPEDALLSRLAGDLLENNKEFAAAIAMFQRSLKLDPCQSSTWASLSDAYAEIGQLDESRAMRREALRLDPSNPRFRNRYPDKKGRYEESFHPDETESKKQSEEVLRSCRSTGPGDFELIRTCLKNSEFLIKPGASIEPGLRVARHLARLRPKDPRIFFVMGRAELHRDRKEADALFTRAAELAPNDARLAFDIALACRNSPAPFQMVRKWALRGRRLDPDAPDFPLLLLQSYGKSHFLQDNFPAEDLIAIRDLTKEVKAHLRSGHRLVYWDDLKNLPLATALETPSGSNENTWNRADLEAWLRNDVQSIADECRRRGIRLVIMNYPRETLFPEYKGLAAGAGALFVDVEKPFDPLCADGSKARYFVADGHCTAEGFGIIARTLLQEMRTAGLLPGVP